MNVDTYMDVPGFSGTYSCSDTGKILNNKTKRELKQFTADNHYPSVCLFNKGVRKNVRVHRLVAKLFVSGYQEGLVVNHIDEDKTNNHYTNLEWVTQRQNMDHSLTKISKASTEANAKHFAITHPSGGEERVFNLSKWCRDNNVNQTGMSRLANGKLSSYKGFKCEVVS